MVQRNAIKLKIPCIFNVIEYLVSLDKVSNKKLAKCSTVFEPNYL